MNVTNVTDYDNSYIYNINVKLYLGGNNMSCGFTNMDKRDGKAVVNLVRSKGKADLPLMIQHEIDCSCGNIFIMKTIIDKCPHCEMTYGVTPCSSRNKENVVAAGIRY